MQRRTCSTVFRTRLLIGSVCLAVACVAADGEVLERREGVDWPAFLGPTGDGKSSETGFFLDGRLRGARVRWHRETGTGYAAPTVSRGRLFLFSRTGERNRLECLRPETGEPLWAFEYPTDYEDLYGYDNGPRCCPIVDDDRVYIVGAEGALHCLSVVDGTVIWKVDTSKRFGVVQNFFGVGSTPVVEGDVLIANVGGSPESSRGVAPGQLERVRGDDSGVVAFDKRTGDVRYQLSDELASYASPTMATIEGRRWGFVFARGGLLGFDPTTGRQDFHFPWRSSIRDSVNAANPVVVGDEVLISETYGPGAALLRVQPGRCDVVWQDHAKKRQKILQCHWSTPIHHAGHVYACSGRHIADAELRCIEWKTGEVKWSQPGLGRGSLLLVEGHFFCLLENGSLFVFRASPEAFEASPEIRLVGDSPGPNAEPERLVRYPAWTAPILARGMLYVRGPNRLVCLELTRGEATP